MIIGLGIDSVDTERFKKWSNWGKKRLLRAFSQQELDYCMADGKKSAERLAVRFAAKEAFFKALCQAYPKKKFFLMNILKNVEVLKKGEIPTLNIQGGIDTVSTLKIFLSLSHSKTFATAIIILEQEIDE